MNQIRASVPRRLLLCLCLPLWIACDEGDSADAEGTTMAPGGAAAPGMPTGTMRAGGTPTDVGGAVGTDTRNTSNAAQQGAMWQSYVAYGVDVYALDGAPWRRMTAQLRDLTPSPDGSWFVYASQGTNFSELGVVDSGSLAPLFMMTISDAKVWGAIPATDNKRLVLSVSSKFGKDQPVDFVFYDVQAQLELKRIPAVGFINWLSGDRYLRIESNGMIYQGGLSLDEQQMGTLSLPTGAISRNFMVNPQGTRIAIQLQQRTVDSTNWDIWLADLDGNHLERFTKTTVSSYAFWSPDGRYLAFNHDADLRCGAVDANCPHLFCEIHVAPESARELIVSNMSPPRPHALNEKNESIYVPCNLHGWTGRAK